MLLSGKTGYVLQNGVARRFGKWETPMEVDEVPANNFVDSPYKIFIPGLAGSTVTVSGPYDAGGMPFVLGATYTLTLGWTPALALVVTGFAQRLVPANDVERNPTLNMVFRVSGAFVAAIT
jgi:hypothetical protein